MSRRHYVALLSSAVILAGWAAARTPVPLPQRKDYLSEAESDKIRDTPSPAARIGVYISFAEDRLKKFDYELHRPVQERRRSEILNSLLNGYVGCVDDAADQVDDAQDKQVDIHEALKSMKAKDKDFLDILEKYNKPGPGFEDYKDSLEDAIEGTKDALSDAADAEKETPSAPVRRKQ